MEYKCLSDFLFKGENKNINISVSKNSPVNASLSLDGYKHSMVQIIALTIALKMKTVIVNPPIVSDTYVFIAIINELGGTAKIYNKRLFIDASTICNANIPFFLGKCIHGSMYLCPALLIALGKFEYYGSGGCQIGDSIDSHNRPFSHIASVIECFNHKISIDSNRIILQLYEKAKHNSGWKNPDGIASSDGRAKKSMQTIVAKGKRLERESEDFTDIPNKEESIITRFDPSVNIPSQKRILDYYITELKVGSNVISREIRLSISGKQHICIIGKNGAGKSTLLRKIWEELKDKNDINIGYMPQNYEEILDFSKTPIEFLESNYDKNDLTKAMCFMGSMKFTTNEMSNKIGELSGGQKAKLIFLNMVLKGCNVLILDEPTRNFSPLSAPIVRQALYEFNGTIISISHDRKYLDEVADIIYVLTESGLSQL